MPATATRPTAAPDQPALGTSRSRVPPLLPVWVPLISAAIISGAVLAWMFPPGAAEGSPPTVRFTDVTEASGIHFVHRMGAEPASSPSTLGAGVVVFDYDGDADEDLFFVNGADWPWEETFAKYAARGGCALFRNDGEGHFDEVSALAGVNLEFPGMAATAGDYDDDGRPDLFVTGIGANHLFHNRGGGRFEDVTEYSGVVAEANTWSTGAVWLDFDADGRLDLIVGHYARWPLEVTLAEAFSVALMGRSYGAPTGFVGVPPSVYRNLGGGRFELVPDGAGLRPMDPATGLPTARLLALVPVDANADGRLDLLLIYHTNEEVLFLNTPDGRFRAASRRPEDRREGAAAGTATGLLALLPGREDDERFAAFQTLLAQDGRSGGVEPSPGVELDARLGVAPIDYDRDGRLDLFAGAARLEPDVNRFEAGRDFAGRPRLWWNRGDRLLPVEVQGLLPAVTRGVATADFDGDGDWDIVATEFGGRPRLLRNDQRDDLPWLGIDLVATRSTREAGGTRVEVHTPRRVHVRVMAPAMGLFAQSSRTLEFGLGDDARVRKVVVEWPSGARQEERAIEINRRITITER